MYLGLSFIAIGLLTLVFLLIEVNQSAPTASYASGADRHLRDRIPEPPRRSARPRQKVKNALPRIAGSDAGRNIRHKEAVVAEDHNRNCTRRDDSKTPIGISTRVAGCYRSSSLPPVPVDRNVVNPGRGSSPKIPVDTIIGMAKDGMNELRIASDLKLGRDEVAMVLNLNRLSKGRVH